MLTGNGFLKQEGTKTNMVRRENMWKSTMFVKEEQGLSAGGWRRAK